MSHGTGEKISVCLLAFNHVDVIESTLMSILDQSIAGYEVIVSDDCSTDGTWERILELGSHDPRIKAVRTPRNLGMPGNANFAVARSSRPYIALLHHDDLYRNDLLEKWAGVLDRHPDVAFVFNPYRKFGSDVIYQDPMPGECIDGKWLLERYLFARWGCVVRGTAMVRRAAWEQVGGMREQFGLLADIDLWMRLAMRWRVGYVAEPLIAVRHARPGYYPAIYTDISAFWARQKYLYEIHGANLLEYLDTNSVSGRVKWARFRYRLSAETAKWMAYAIIRKKPELLATCNTGATQYDLFPLRVVRTLVRTLRRFVAGGRDGFSASTGH